MRPTGPVAPAQVASAETTPIVERWITRSDLATWRVRAPDGAEGEMPAQWPANLAAATRGGWQSSTAGAIASSEAWTLLDAAGGVQARLLWAPGSLLVCEAPTGRCERATFRPPRPNPLALQMPADVALLEALRRAVRR